MRFAIVAEPEVDSARQRCAIRSVPAARRPLEREPDDAEKSRVTRSRAVEAEPDNAAKGERGTSRSGAIRC